MSRKIFLHAYMLLNYVLPILNSKLEKTTNRFIPAHLFFVRDTTLIICSHTAPIDRFFSIPIRFSADFYTNRRPSANVMDSVR